MKKILSLLTLLLCVCSGAWASQTTLITGATLPDIPSTSLDLSSQTTYSANANGWIVFDPSGLVNTTSTWWNYTSKGTQTANAFTAADLSTTAPFVDRSESAAFKINTGNTAAIRFTGAEKASFLVQARATSSGKEVHLALFTYDSSASPTQTQVGSELTTTVSTAEEKIFEGLDASKTYVVYVFNGGKSQNSCLMEIALKAPTASITSKVLTGININDVAWDISGLSENAATISTAYIGAPSVEFVYTINYDDSSTMPNQKETVVATADGDNYVATSTQLTSNVTLTFANVTVRSASDLAIASGKGTVNTTVGASNYTLTSGTDFTTSSDGTLSFASSIPGVAYVDAATGELQFLGAGTTTITLTQAEGSAYEGGSVSFTVNVLPAACLNLGDKDAAIAQLKKGWLFDSPYFDTENKQVIISGYAAVNSANQGYQPWIGLSKNTDGKATPDKYVVGGTSDNKATWSATGVFKGATGYYSDSSTESNARYTTLNSSRPWTPVNFRVKGASKAQALVKGNNSTKYLTFAAYEISDGSLSSVAADSKNTSDGNETVLELTLDANKEYLVKVSNDTYTSNAQLFEIAFTASASDIEIPSNRITTSAAGWASYTPMYKVSSTIYKRGSGSAANDITVYAVSAVEGNDATMSEVTEGMAANNGYFLKGAANTTYRTTATAGSPVAPATNLIKAQTETGTVKSEGDYTRYALLTYDAENYGLYKLNSTGVTIPAGKAYLEVPVVAARAFDFLNFNFDGETTGINKVVPAEAVKDGVQKFYENGKLVIMRNGVKYNVAGAQVK